MKRKAAIVTGGAMGIGEAIALRLAEAGASVMIADISIEAANNVVDKIKSRGGSYENPRIWRWRYRYNLRLATL